MVVRRYQVRAHPRAVKVHAPSLRHALYNPILPFPGHHLLPIEIQTPVWLSGIGRGAGLANTVVNRNGPGFDSRDQRSKRLFSEGTFRNHRPLSFRMGIALGVSFLYFMCHFLFFSLTVFFSYQHFLYCSLAGFVIYLEKPRYTLRF
ncbi:hypothetical protein B0J18DRAFT_264708 [Chaetomium sp. MPI-SDFR-AT-0129]|nr:hypothetical protein B0J18DRAFT_264708 [Chaetomium sp. MPI-SDFR-AT-0129]